MSRIAFVLSIAAVALACGGPEVRHPYQADDKTPANSSSESRLNGEDPSKPKPTTATSATQPSDPTQPQVSSVNDMPKSSDDGSTRASGGSGKSTGKSTDKNANKDEPAAKGSKPSKTGPRASRAECDKAFEKALELEISSRPEFADLDKGELMKMAKQMAAQQHGQAPCDASKAQYSCAMGAKSTAEWKRCME